MTNLESMVSTHCTTLIGHVTTIRTCCFDADFASQMKLTKFPLIHCFEEILHLFLILHFLPLCLFISKFVELRDGKLTKSLHLNRHVVVLHEQTS